MQEKNEAVQSAERTPGASGLVSCHEEAGPGLLAHTMVLQLPGNRDMAAQKTPRTQRPQNPPCMPREIQTQMNCGTSPERPRIRLALCSVRQQRGRLAPTRLFAPSSRRVQVWLQSASKELPLSAAGSYLLQLAVAVGALLGCLPSNRPVKPASVEPCNLAGRLSPS